MTLSPWPIAEGRLAVSDGEVWYQTINGAAPRVALLCLHGGPGMPHDYLEPLAQLADQRPVIFYDQLGCGRSPASAGSPPWTVDRFLAELVSVRSHLGLDEVILFGNSWGGMLALRYVLDRPAGVRGLILSSAPVSVTRWMEDAAKLRAALPASVQATLDSHERSGFFSCPEYLGAVAEFYRRHLCRLTPWPDCLERTMAGLGAEVYEAMWGHSEFGPVTGALRTWEMAGRLPEVAIPTLVTVGRFDEASPAHMGQLAAGIPGAELAVFEHSSHLAFLEEQQPYLARLRSYLDRVDPHRDGRSGSKERATS